MKRFFMLRNITATDEPVGLCHGAAPPGSTPAIAGWLVSALAAGALTVAALPAQAQVRPQVRVDRGAAADRQSARRQMDNFRNRMRQGHQRGQQRALDTNERTRRDRERQIERLDDLRRQRSR
jgi:hypothetical protein